MDRRRPTNLKRSRGERVSWGGEAEVKSTGTVPLLRRRHKVNTSAQPSGLQGTHGTAAPTLSPSRSLSSGAALSSLGSAGNGCFTHKRRKEHRHRVAPNEAFKDLVRLSGIVSPKHSHRKDRRELLSEGKRGAFICAGTPNKQRCHRSSGADLWSAENVASSCLSGAPARRSRRRSRVIGGKLRRETGCT